MAEADFGIKPKFFNSLPRHLPVIILRGRAFYDQDSDPVELSECAHRLAWLGGGPISFTIAWPGTRTVETRLLFPLSRFRADS